MAEKGYMGLFWDGIRFSEITPSGREGSGEEK